ncbi:MAG: F0F1 ATP synthase subunit A [Spirochaetaceae bacterium]|nr:F0F1 ATP synthase subunit A [Spirochaetaceae bacterium]
MKVVLLIVAAVAVLVLGNLLVPVPRAAIEVAAEPIGLGPVTNAMLTSFILSAVILAVAFVVGRTLKLRPGGLQNVVEALIEGLGNLVNQTATRTWAPRFFPICCTIFIFLLISNWFGILGPGLGSVGIIHASDHGTLDAEDITFLRGSAEQVLADHAAKYGADAHHGVDEARFVVVPLLRAPSSDLNLTLALALITMFLVQVFGFWSRGIGYVGQFLRFKSLKTKGFGMGLVDVFVGLFEGLSEFAKVISFSFRLFGNIFAGEVILIVISSLVSLVLVVVFFGLEMFVGLIQAFVFFILSLAFFHLATEHHDDH